MTSAPVGRPEKAFGGPCINLSAGPRVVVVIIVVFLVRLMFLLLVVGL
jgi:hypothetical protein